MLLEDKNAVIYGGGGSIGGAVARAFGREGARVFLAGRTRATLEGVAEEIRVAGGTAETAEVDALDEQAVDTHADAVASEAGGIDVSFNLITHPYAHGTPLAEMTLEDFMPPIVTAASTMFVTSRAAARHMIKQGSGVILVFGGSGDPLRDYYLGGTQVAFDAMESMRRQLSAELGPHGVRVVTLRTGRDARRRRQRGGLRGLRPCSHHDRGHGQHQLRRAGRLSSKSPRDPRARSYPVGAA